VRFRAEMCETAHPQCAVTSLPRDRLAGIVVVMLSNTLAVLPLFLLGALAVFIRQELRFGEARLGLAISLYFVVAALSSMPGGRLSERLGAPAAMASAVTISGTCMLGVAMAARSWSMLALLLAVSGIGSGVGQPSSNLAIARLVPTPAQGLAFGVKQAAIPMGTLLAGLAVPILGLTVGWRWGFATGAVLAIPVAIACARLRVSQERRAGRSIREGDASPGPMVLLAIAGGTAATAVSGVGSFYVESAVTGGVSTGTAGLLFAFGSAMGVTGRILWGWVGDQLQGGWLLLVGALMGTGSVGTVLLALPSQRVLLVLGTVLVFVCAWGWNGLFNFAVVRLNPHAPGAATGITQTGVFIGGIAGPLAFGALVEAGSYPLAWSAVTAALLAAAALVVVAHRFLRQDRAFRERVEARRGVPDA
jgi:MFS family permease